MNEAGVFGRFVPDFGRVVAQMQFDMYHHYTVDEHSIRAIGLLAAIDAAISRRTIPCRPRSSEQIASRRVLYVAVLLHDIAKGRGGDHSVLGAEIALKLCPRFGLDQAETETVAGWSAIICCSRRPRSSATSPIPRRSRISSARCKAPSGCGCC